MRGLCAGRSTALAGVVLVCLVLICGCGRKLPPQPPGLASPVVVRSIGFTSEGVAARLTCNVPGATVVLLGKPKGICPHCTDDLTRRASGVCPAGGRMVLLDPAPGGGDMVYRVALEKDGTSWLGEARIVKP